MVTMGLHQLLNTLYITTQGSFLRLDHDTLRVELDGETLLRVPTHHIGGIVCFGRITVSTAVIANCASEGRDLVFMSRGGRFQARVVGPVSGNVLLRMAQHDIHLDQDARMDIARSIVAGKLQNARRVLTRGARETKDPGRQNRLRAAADIHARALRQLEHADSLDEARGLEGEAASAYFFAFSGLIRESGKTFAFNGRNRRPPRDPVNALMSFIYALVSTNCVAALEEVGLDPQIGFLHGIRPGRASLGLDLMEEMRPALADRLALTLINRRQVNKQHFIERPGGGVLLNDDGRREVITAYQKRKEQEVRHQLLDRRIPMGLIPSVQARLLARHLRGDLGHYIPYTPR